MTQTNRFDKTKTTRFSLSHMLSIPLPQALPPHTYSSPCTVMLPPPRHHVPTSTPPHSHTFPLPHHTPTPIHSHLHSSPSHTSSHTHTPPSTPSSSHTLPFPHVPTSNMHTPTHTRPSLPRLPHRPSTVRPWLSCGLSGKAGMMLLW